MKTGNGYTVTPTTFPNVITTSHAQYGVQVWCLSSMTKRHRFDACAVCGKVVGLHAFRSVSNRGNRMMRICKACGQS